MPPTPKRSTLPLPRYTRRKWLRAEGKWAYFFDLPSWARKDPACPLHNEPLGADYDAAVRKVEHVLLPLFDSWRSGGATDMVPKAEAVPGTFNWMVAEFKRDKRYKDLDAGTRKSYDYGLELARSHILKDGRRFGDVQVKAITPDVADRLHERILVAHDPVLGDDGEPVLDAKGNPVTVERERRTTANRAMRTCRRAWKVVHRKHTNLVPQENPFSKMGLQSAPAKETPTADLAELSAFIRHCDENGRASLGTAALLAWEWVQREEDIFGIFGTFDVRHYRPKERPNAARVLHEKTRQEAWVPLFDEDGAALYPELMARLDAVKRSRVGGLMIIRDWNDRKAKVPLPWITAKADLTYMRHEVKRLLVGAGLRPDLTFTSFRHGGMTEAGESDLTDREIQALSRHKTVHVIPRYAKRTMKQVATVAKKRRATRTKPDGLSE